jgi:phosphoribosylglycinamide formyltransferase 1
MKKINIAVLASGYGSNFQALAEKFTKKSPFAEITLLVVNKKTAFALKRAKKLGIRSILLDDRGFKSPRDFERKLLTLLREEEISLILLAGYMKIIGPQLLEKYKNRIINIHPSLLPAFKGTRAIKRAFDYGCKYTGVTVHFVNERLDGGPIIAQKVIPIEEGSSLSQLENKIHSIEHKLYPQTVEKIVSGKIKINKRKVKIAK